MRWEWNAEGNAGWYGRIDTSNYAVAFIDRDRWEFRWFKPGNIGGDIQHSPVPDDLRGDVDGAKAWAEVVWRLS